MLFQDSYEENLNVGGALEIIIIKHKISKNKSFCCTKSSCLHLIENKRLPIICIKLTNGQEDTLNRTGGRSIFLPDTDPHLYLGGSLWSFQIILTSIIKM